MRPVALRVHLSEAVPAEIVQALEADFELVASPAGADGIVAMLTVVVDDAYLEAAGPQLRIVANYAVGVNNVDLDAARRRGIVVANTPDVLTGATAELALTLMLPVSVPAPGATAPKLRLTVTAWPTLAGSGSTLLNSITVLAGVVA